MRVFQTEQKHLWIEERPTSNRTLQAALIIPCEVKNGETHRHTNNLLQNSKKEKRRFKNVDSQLEFRGRSQEFEPQ
jgi:hypothetical protein